jgi:formylglycine-generating enzyme required for sulfatase activity
MWGILLSLTLEAQTKPSLTILPFTGAVGGDEEIITLLFANQGDLRTAFTVIPCTSNFKRITEETVLPDSVEKAEDIIAEVRGQLKTDFTILVRTERIGASNLVLISLVEMRTLREVAGEYRQYSTLREFRSFVPAISAKLIQGAENIRNDLPKLTVLPFYTPNQGAEIRQADILVQLLTIELANRGTYAVLPWALSIETLIRNLSIPYVGIIDPVRIKTIGIITHIPYVLAGDLLNLGSAHLFMASIVDTEDASLVRGGDMEYTVITEELPSLEQLAAALVGTVEEEGPSAIPEPLLAEESLPEKEEPPPVVVHLPEEPAAPPAPVRLPEKRAIPESLVRIPDGIFTMGSPLSEIARDADEVPHGVRMLGFYMGKYEVSQRDYAAVMGINPSYFKGAAFPVERVNWFDAIGYCNARSIQEGLTPAYSIDEEHIIWNREANGYRLPTEAEWEYACRAGTTTAFNVGDTITTNQSNYDGTYRYRNSRAGVYRQQPTTVESFPANPWGLHNMHGNVYEWCWDGYGPYGSEEWVPNRRIVRGGGWYSAPQYLRSANRVRMSPYTKTSYVGFRVVRNAE